MKKKRVKKMLWFKYHPHDIFHCFHFDIKDKMLPVISMKSLKQRSSTLLNHTIFFKPFLMNQNAILNTEQKRMVLLSRQLFLIRHEMFCLKLILILFIVQVKSSSRLVFYSLFVITSSLMMLIHFCSVFKIAFWFIKNGF